MKHASTHGDHYEMTDHSICESEGLDSPPDSKACTHTKNRSKKPSGREGYILKKFRKEENDISLDELGKRITDISLEFQKRKLSDEDSSPEEREGENRKWKRDGGSVCWPMSPFRGIIKSNGNDVMTAVVLKKKEGLKKIFPCYRDDDVFKVEDGVRFSHALHSHGRDNDDDTGSEDLNKGTKKIINHLNETLKLCRAKSPVRFREKSPSTINIRKYSTISINNQGAKNLSEPSSPTKESASSRNSAHSRSKTQDLRNSKKNQTEEKEDLETGNIEDPKFLNA